MYECKVDIVFSIPHEDSWAGISVGSRQTCSLEAPGREEMLEAIHHAAIAEVFHTPTLASILKLKKNGIEYRSFPVAFRTR